MSKFILGIFCVFFLSLGAASVAEAGSKIAFSSFRDGNYEIYVMDADGSNQTNISNTSSHDIYPAWSPDGNHIAFTAWRDGNAEIYLMDEDGSNQTNISNNSSNDDSPAWSPELPEPVPTTSPMGQVLAVLILGGATAVYLNRRRQSAGA